MRKSLLGALGIAGMCVVTGAQERDYQPSCAMCPGTYIGKSEIDLYVKRAIANDITDQSESDSKADLKTDGRATAGGGAGAVSGVPPQR